MRPTAPGPPACRAQQDLQLRADILERPTAVLCAAEDDGTFDGGEDRGGQPPCADPVWFARDADGQRLYVWTEQEAFKAKRLRRDPRALLAPCTPRGVPLGPPIAARGRVLDTEAERTHAAETIRRAWGPLRRLFERASRPVTPVAYLELVPE